MMLPGLALMLGVSLETHQIDPDPTGQGHMGLLSTCRLSTDGCRPSYKKMGQPSEVQKINNSDDCLDNDNYYW